MTEAREKPRLESWMKTFSQSADCCDKGDSSQTICIQQEDGGGGPYWVVQTNRWAITSIDDLATLLRDAEVPEKSV